ncbi:hypothetical protein [Enemella sp. A6]|uniref:hypothetical protein n=1 Tax=Enemella sp. A6 TaxID=3440152 RepID=UPI003EBD801F
MDQLLEDRLRITAETGMATPEIVAFVSQLLAELDSEYVVTEQTAGMFAAHLMAALERVRTGDTSVGEPNVAHVAEARTASPSSPARARAIADRAAAELGLTLPKGEIDFLTIHLATLYVAHRKENR